MGKDNSKVVIDEVAGSEAVTLLYVPYMFVGKALCRACSQVVLL
jgi:hypothetical protein